MSQTAGHPELMVKVGGPLGLKKAEMDAAPPPSPAPPR